MPDILREEAEHSLDLDKKGSTSQATASALRSGLEEVTRLLAIGFIHEVTHPEWLADQSM
jgi:hypothetical protein